MKEDVQASNDVSSRILHIFLNEDLGSSGEAGRIEGKNREQLNNKL